jgi:DNA-binding NtrC family response regulator
MRRVRAQVGVAAGCGASVLVVGPAGSGRRRVAAAIHADGTDESAGMLIPVDCAILTAESIASTVGAMTGRLACDDRTAHHTLLLTDVDTLGPDAQERLLAMLCSRQLPVRLISTSRQTLDDAAQNGTFRPDLAMLLATIVIPLPPLCERREDIPMVAQQLLEDLNLRGPRQLGGFTPDALDRLDGYSWPGNLDELAAVVAKAYRQAEGPLVTVRDLPEQIHLAAADSARPKRREDPIVLDQFLARIERELIQRALARAKGNKARAARLLGLTRPRLYRRMVQLKLITE